MSTNSITPVQFMMEHKKIMLDTYNKDSSPKRSWVCLCEIIPEIESVMKFNTFKQYFSPFVLIIKEYEERDNNVAGWTISKGKDGYYRGKKRKDGKLHSVYLGKEFDREAFTSKVLKKQNTLGIE